MPNFLTQTARDILQNHPSLKKVGIILPSRRAAVFLKRELSQQIEKPIWSPYINTIEDFLLESLNWKQADQSGLMFQLYQCYTEVAPQPQERFADFSQWAHLLLADFNEIDRYKVDARELFAYLSDVERIKKWNLEPGQELTELVKNYLKLWESLPALYQKFTSTLAETGEVYQGMAYRKMSEELENHLPAIKGRFEKLIFIGFNALNAAEEDILLKLYREGVAEFYWDVDDYYFNDLAQEAGNFLRNSKLVRELIDKDDFKWRHDSLSTIPKKIKVINVSGRHLMAVAANSSVLEFQEQQLENVAVALADEELLPLFLNNLADDIPTLNVTMGLPMTSTPVAGFFQLLLDMLQEFENTGRRDSLKRPAFHFQKWDDLLSHHLFKIWCGDAVFAEALRLQIRDRNRIFISVEELEGWSSGSFTTSVIKFFTENINGSISEMWTSLSEVAQAINDQHQNKDVLLQALFGFFKLFNRLADLMNQYPFVDDVKTAVRFYRDLVRSETLDIYGEPLSGLQVMGMLETRTLDFGNLVITSLNEDVLPKGKSQNSLIPFDIKREFGLPTYLDKDAVFAYHFYRLIQRAENIHLIYNGLSEGLGSGEASRFIRQLQFEAGPNITFEEMSPAFGIDTSDTVEEEIVKTPAVMARLYEMAQEGFSATALIDYINDPLEFYKKRVLKLREADEVEEVAGYDTQGNVVHELLEQFYSVDGKKEKVKSILKASDPIFAQSKDEIRKLVVEQLQDKAKLSDLDKGKNLLIREILTGMVVNFLKKEKEELQKLEQAGEVLSMIGLEGKYNAHLTLKSGLEVNLKGIIDRIDRVGKDVRLIDYKTGSVLPQNISINEMADMRQPKDKNKSLQLMMYAWLFFKEEVGYDEISPAIISLRKANDWLMPLKVGKSNSISRELMPDFEEFLTNLLEEIFNPNIAFTKKPLTLVTDE